MIPRLANSSKYGCSQQQQQKPYPNCYWHRGCHLLHHHHPDGCGWCRAPKADSKSFATVSNVPLASLDALSGPLPSHDDILHHVDLHTSFMLQTLLLWQSHCSTQILQQVKLLNPVLILTKFSMDNFLHNKLSLTIHTMKIFRCLMRLVLFKLSRSPNRLLALTPTKLTAECRTLF